MSCIYVTFVWTVAFVLRRIFVVGCLPNFASLSTQRFFKSLSASPFRFPCPYPLCNRLFKGPKVDYFEGRRFFKCTNFWVAFSTHGIASFRPALLLEKQKEVVAQTTLFFLVCRVRSTPRSPRLLADPPLPPPPLICVCCVAVFGVARVLFGRVMPAPACHSAFLRRLSSHPLFFPFFMRPFAWVVYLVVVVFCRVVVWLFVCLLFA